MREGMETLLTVSAVNAACLLRAHPHTMERFTRITDRYVDWRGRTVLCRTNFGARLACNLTDFIQRKIAYFGVWEPHLTAYFQRVLKRGDIFVDIGANIGYYSLLAAQLVGPDGEVIAIEASPKIFASLIENIRRNRCTNIRAVNYAAARECGRLPIFSAPSGNIGHTSTIPLDGNSFDCFVEAKPLHQILSKEELTGARLLKIDIEGAEGPVIDSFADNIDLYGPRCELAVEVSPSCSWILERMNQLGFHPYRISNDYSDRDYLSRSERRPARYRQKLTEQCDFIFSRLDKDYL
jgi:FkbM family methyltransferase